MTLPLDFVAATTAAVRVHERVAIEQAISRMAIRIRNDYAGDRPVYLTVMQGALPFSAQLALALGALRLDLAFDYVHATRYRGQTQGSDLQWKHRPATPLHGERVLLVDDIVDEGHTLAAVRAWCIGEGARDVRIAALAVKQHDRCVPGLRADYSAVLVPDRYVFGYGMDYHEQGRNLPDIYAL
jgi:hypoxanthine phosphoribosyltransferase